MNPIWEPSQFEVFVSHLGQDKQQAPVHVGLELYGGARILRETVLSVLSTEVESSTTEGGMCEIAAGHGEKGTY